MKKILFGVLIAFTAVFSSCNTHFGDDNSEEVEKYGIYLLNQTVIAQHIAVTDPFNVALRLSALIVESGSYTDQTVKDKLFGNGTTIDYDQENGGTYYINYAGSLTNDLTRTGITVINTKGYANLQEANAIWEIKTLPTSPYTTMVPLIRGGIVVNIPDETQAYTIENSVTGWTVRMRNIQTYYPSDSSEKSDWTGTYEIIPEVLSGSSEVFNSKYTMDINVVSSKTIDWDDVLNVSTEIPIRFNPLCGARALAPGGKMKVVLASANLLDPKSFFTTTWLENGSGCKPPFTITFGGQTQEYEGIN